MRKKGEIWKQRYQQLIVDSYRRGMPVSKILELDELQNVAASEYLIRQILKENNVKTVWRRAKANKKFWRPEVVNRIVSQRDAGKSLSEITEDINNSFADLNISRSTIVRILDESKPEGSAGRQIPKEKREQLSRLIVEKYNEGMLVRDICKLPRISRFKLSDYSVRRILKENGVELTGRKGELRRWPENLKQRIADLYQEGMTFDEIKQDEEIAENKPTDYAIRNILRRKGIVTRKPSYLKPISMPRYQRYRDGKMGNKETSMIHKHLARFREGRVLMLRRMGLQDIDAGEMTCISDEQKKSLTANARNWRGFFHWGMQFLYDDELKRRLFELGIEYSRALNYLRRACRENDKTRQEKALLRIDTDIAEMATFQTEILLEPASKFRLQPAELTKERLSIT